MYRADHLKFKGFLIQLRHQFRNRLQHETTYSISLDLGENRKLQQEGKPDLRLIIQNYQSSCVKQQWN